MLSKVKQLDTRNPILKLLSKSSFDFTLQLSSHSPRTYVFSIENSKEVHDWLFSIGFTFVDGPHKYMLALPGMTILRKENVYIRLLDNEINVLHNHRQLFIRKSGYKYVVPPSLRRNILFKDVISVRKKLVKLNGRFHKVTYFENREPEVRSEFVVWKWKSISDDSELIFRVRILNRYSRDYSLFISRHPGSDGLYPFPNVGVSWVDEIYKEELDSIMKRWFNEDY